MPVTPTYPGVYIEELPATTHTIVGVATSITAFVGYTKRGPANLARQIFSFGDFQRTFGDLDPDCPLTYAVQQFFLNGGSEAYIVRVAHGATTASVGLIANAITSLILTGASSGAWANTLQVTVDRGTLNPNSLFSLTVTEYTVSGGGALVPGRQESYRNLTMNSQAAGYAVDTINASSQLLQAQRGAIPANMPAAGTSESGSLPKSITLATNQTQLVIEVSGAPATLTLTPGTYDPATIATDIVAAAAAASLKITETDPGAGKAGQITFSDATTAPADQRSSVHFTTAPSNDATALLMLGVANGGTEIDAIAIYHPESTGTVAADLDASLGAGGLAGLIPPVNQTTQFNVQVTLPGQAATPLAQPLTLLNPTDQLLTKADLRSRLETVIQGAALANPTFGPELGQASVAIINNCLVLSSGGRPDAMMTILDVGTPKVATLTGFGAATQNVAAYSPSSGAVGGQAAGTTGFDGTPPLATDLPGDQVAKTGLYALENVDLFNLLVMPDDICTDTSTIVADAMAYCEQRRAFMLVDLPTSQKTLSQAQTWIVNPSTPKSNNAAAYFPRELFPDAMQSYRPRVMPTAGAIAGVYARTDASRGIWKAPAGINATLVGPTSVQVPLTDMENGTINPLGLNAVRSLPVYGIVTWGARTLNGADVMASQWKYVPIRRTALYIEESLYRGTKWVVFEPNDDPLWAQIRLSVTSFMQSMFVQGAFQGASPRQAYLVKCDSETTTQNDIDQGIVNILVGFAPLKPAEFVVIQITQLAGQVDS